MAFVEGIGGSIGFSFSKNGFGGVSISGYLPPFPGKGIGFAVGIDICMIITCQQQR